MKSSTLTLLSILLLTISQTVILDGEDIGPPLELPRIEASYHPPYYTTIYEQPENPEERQLKLGVNFTLWIPEGLNEIRGIVFRQHGCSSGSCIGSVTSAHDLHWQELARRNDCALLAGSYHQNENQDCGWWVNPHMGSGQVLLSSLEKLAELSGHPEVTTVPWCIRGHSGGGYWASYIQEMFPERIVAVWFQSGAFYQSPQFDESSVNPKTLDVPSMLIVGAKEKDHPRFKGLWAMSKARFIGFRSVGAPIGFLNNPVTEHESGESRYVNIPFFDACLKLRLPDKIGDPLRPIEANSGWLAPADASKKPVPAEEYEGESFQAVWLPDKITAKAWYELANTGTVEDTTAPPAPYDVTYDETGTITWKSSVDFESGLQAFIIEKDGEVIGQIPENPTDLYSRPLFQGLNFGDNPKRLLQFKFVDTSYDFRRDYNYRVIGVNSAGLKSE